MRRIRRGGPNWISPLTYGGHKGQLQPAPFIAPYYYRPDEVVNAVVNAATAGAERLGLCPSRPYRTTSFAAADGAGGGVKIPCLLAWPVMRRAHPLQRPRRAERY